MQYPKCTLGYIRAPGWEAQIENTGQVPRPADLLQMCCYPSLTYNFAESCHSTWPLLLKKKMTHLGNTEHVLDSTDWDKLLTAILTMHAWNESGRKCYLL